jgi:hypothetical protein
MDRAARYHEAKQRWRDRKQARSAAGTSQVAHSCCGASSCCFFTDSMLHLRRQLYEVV